VEERSAMILRAVVDDFVRYAEPVGSKRLTDGYKLGVSPATVRNEMSRLEEEGYLAHPHTSAGRIPTDKGYRFYVDTLARIGPLARAQEETIAQFFQGSADLEETLRRTSLLLSGLTHLAAMVVAPRVDRSRLRHLELVGLGPRLVLLVLIFDTGRVEKILLELHDPAAQIDLEAVRTVLNNQAAGKRFDLAEKAVAKLATDGPEEFRGLFKAVSGALTQARERVPVERVYVGGAAHMAEEGCFEGFRAVQRVFEVLEQHVILLRMLQDAMARGGVAVTIGSENTVEGMDSCSVVSMSYDVGGAVGGLGVLGPTRMDYRVAMAAVQAVSRHLADALANLGV
jgi:heat-inducible transcriptional repressor